MTTAAESYKVILLGNMGVGKTSLILSFLDSPFAEMPTEIIDFKTLTRKVDGVTVNLVFTDTAGQEEFRSLTSSNQSLLSPSSSAPFFSSLFVPYLLESSARNL